MCPDKNDFGVVLLRPVSEKNLELMMAWRSNSLVFEGFYLQNAPLTWEEHRNWWGSRYNRMDWVVSLEEDGQVRDVGIVNVSGLGTKVPSVGIYIGEVTLWGKKIGSRAVRLAIDWLSMNGYEEAQANILKDNIASIKLFESLGFKRVGEGREGEWVYRRVIHESG